MDRRREEGEYAGAEREQGGRREMTKRKKQQRRGRKIVHVCCGILRQLTAVKVVKREAGKREE